MSFETYWYDTIHQIVERFSFRSTISDFLDGLFDMIQANPMYTWEMFLMDYQKNPNQCFTYIVRNPMIFNPTTIQEMTFVRSDDRLITTTKCTFRGITFNIPKYFGLHYIHNPTCTMETLYSKKVNMLPERIPYVFLLNIAKHPLMMNLESYKKNRTSAFCNVLSLSCNPSIHFQDILDNPDIPWSTNGVSLNPSITWSDVINNPTYAWNFGYLSGNPNITLEMMEENPQYKWSEDYFLRNPNNTFSNIIQYLIKLSNQIDSTNMVIEEFEWLQFIAINPFTLERRRYYEKHFGWIISDITEKYQITDVNDIIMEYL
jgi:hypothetical protein